MSKEWSILFEGSSNCHLIDEPLIDIFENAARVRESDIVIIDDEMVKISKISDRLFCLYVLQSIEIPSFIRSIGSCMRFVDMNLEMPVVPSFIEEIQGFCGFDSIESLRFGMGSCVREIRGFVFYESLRRIEIPSSAEIVFGFDSCDSLTEVIFENGRRIQEIDICNFCKSLVEIEIPASLEVLRGFDHCPNMMRITFAPPCRLRVVEGFLDCPIRSIEIPASVESVIGFDSRWFCQFIFAEGTTVKRMQVRNISSLENRYSQPVFVDYCEQDLRKSRCRLNLV
jgi:hypothetical protein